MADPVPTPTPPPTPAPVPAPAPSSPPSISPLMLPLYWKAVIASVMTVSWALVAFMALRNGTVPPPPPDLNFLITTKSGEKVATGWHNDPKAVKDSNKSDGTQKFSSTPAGQALMAADADVYLWRAVRQVNGKDATANWYPNVNQQDVGCCVGCGFKHSVDVCQAVQIVQNGRKDQWKQVSVEEIYGGSRVIIGGGQIQGDGSVGAWAKEFILKNGVAEMTKYDSVDLTTFSPARARQFGQTGPPKDVLAAAASHIVKGVAQVNTWDDVNKAIRQGYPVAVCSSVGYADPDGSPGTRDKDGFCRARGSWGHCMAFIGVRGGARPGAFCLNSWGDNAHSGPCVPSDAPPAGFWVDADNVNVMVGMGDSFALADMQGFPARQLDWFVKDVPNKKNSVVAFNNLQRFDVDLTLKFPR